MKKQWYYGVLMFIINISVLGCQPEDPSLLELNIENGSARILKDGTSINLFGIVSTGPDTLFFWENSPKTSSKNEIHWDPEMIKRKPPSAENIYFFFGRAIDSISKQEYYFDISYSNSLPGVDTLKSNAPI